MARLVGIVALTLVSACFYNPTGTTIASVSSTAISTGTTDPGPAWTGVDETATTTDEGQPDLGGPDTTTAGAPTCEVTGGCNRLDLLFVIDNSGEMADEQANLVAALPHLVTRLRELVGEDGLPVAPDVHVMVTTTDVGHPLCEPFNKPDYAPARGAPITSPCTLRINRFTGVGANPEQRDEVCTDACPESQIAAPVDPFVQFDAEGHNVMTSGVGDPVVDALGCLLPQGIDGCGFESPLEAMLQALDPAAEWNAGPQPFLRPGAALAIVLVGDETDCSVRDLRHFNPANIDPMYNQYWEDLPGMPGVKDEPTSAVCWNASMTCEVSDPVLGYYSCEPEEKGVLHPISRYTGLLVDSLGGEQDKPVFMLVVTGIPTTGIEDLVHRDWTQNDILPADTDTPKQKEYDYGIGPGCSNPATGNGLPPGRIRQLCEALDVADDPNTPADESDLRCCFESVCNTDLSGGFDCLADNLARSLRAAD